MDSKDEYNTSKENIGDSTLSSNVTASETLAESADLKQNLQDNSDTNVACTDEVGGIYSLKDLCLVVLHSMEESGNPSLSQNHPSKTLAVQQLVHPDYISDEPSLRNINNEERLGAEKSSIVEPRNNEAENSVVPPTVQPGVPETVQPEVKDRAVPDKIQPEIGDNQRKAFFYISSSEIKDSAVQDTMQPETGGIGEDNQRKAFFYISSSEIKDGSQSQSVSGVYKIPSETSVRRIVRQESREPRRCLGSRRCHFIIVAIALMTALVGCIMYHVSDYGGEILKTIGASTTFISIVVCLFSSLYISYLSNYPQLLSSVPNFELLGDVDSVMAMNRTSNPQHLYDEDSRYDSSDTAEHRLSQNQYSDILDRRIFRKHSDESRIELKRFSVDFSSSYSTPPLKRFKAKTGIDVEGIRLTEFQPQISTSNQATIPPETVKETYYGISSAETSTDSQLTNLPVTVDEISDDLKNGNRHRELDAAAKVPANSESNDDVKGSKNLSPGKTG